MNHLAVDLPIGVEFEVIVFERTKKKYQDTVRKLGYCLAYDIEVPSRGIKLECKNDLKSHETGNIVVEYECYGKPSGISTSEADWWVIKYFHQGWYGGYVKASALKELCSHCRKVKGGDDGASRMYLVPVKELVNYIQNPFKVMPS